MRRLLVLPLLALAAFAGTAQAGPPPVPDGVHCTGAYVDGNEAGICAGIVCVDLCGPRPYVRPYCTLDVIDAMCAFQPIGR